MKLPFSKKKGVATKATPSLKPKLKEPMSKDMIRKTTKEWLVIDEIAHSFIYRKDNHILSYFQVQPINISLLSKSEKALLIDQLKEALNSIPVDYDIISIPKPVDLDPYIMELDELKNATEDYIKRSLLQDEIERATVKQMDGEAIDRLFYFVLSQKIIESKNNAENQLLSITHDVIQSLNAAQLQSSRCNDEGIRELIFLFFNPNQASYEKAFLDQYQYSPLYEKEK